MNVIIDSNILISALIRDSVTRKIITLSKEKFLFPEVAVEEIEKYKMMIMEKSEIDEEYYDSLLSRLFNHISLIRLKKIEGMLKEAKKIMKAIDPKDVVFVACALAYPKSVIWSDDKDFKKQKRIKVVNTNEMIELHSEE